MSALTVLSAIVPAQVSQASQTPRSTVTADPPGLGLSHKPTAATPIADQDPGLVRIGALVKLTSPTAGATVSFTTDGTTPSCVSGHVYAGNVVVASDLILKAVGCKAGYNDSPVLSIAFSARAPVTRYISSSGTDSNDGATALTPWLHMPGQTGCASRCSALGSVVGGDQYLFRRGDRWADTSIAISHPGDSGANVTVGTYGSGEKPSLSAPENEPLFHSIGVNRGYWTIDGLDLHATGHVHYMHGAITIFNDWFTAGAASDAPQPGWVIQNCHSDGQFFLAGNPVVRKNMMNGTRNHGTEHGNGADARGGGNGAASGAIIVSGSGSAGAEIYQNTVFNWTGRGVWIADGAHNAIVHDNLIYDIYSWERPDKCWCAMGIDLDGAGTPEDGNIAYNNDLSSFFGQGIALENQTHAIVFGNRIRNTRGAAIGSVHYDGRDGTYTLAGVPAYNLIYANVMWDVWSCGGTGGEPYTSWVHNTCVAGSNTFGGIGDSRYHGAPDTSGWSVSNVDHHEVFVDNIITGFKCPVSAPANTTAWTHFDYNDLFGTSTSIYCQGKRGKTLTETRASGLMSHGVSSEPRFNNPAGHDFTLRSGSPAARAGIALPPPLDKVLAPSTQFPWKLQPQGAEPNIGAFGSP